MDIRDIAQRLARDARSVCADLLPNGKAIGHEWESDPGDGKIKVHLDGDKSGVWSHFGGDGAGDLLDLYVKVKGGSIGEALDWARARLGIEKPAFVGQQKREYRRPQAPAQAKKPERSSVQESVDYYLRQERGLAPATVAAFRVREAPYFDYEKDGEAKKWEGPWIIFPYLRPTDGKLDLINIKWLHRNRRVDPKTGKPKKTMLQEKDCEPGLFGWQAASPMARRCVITEGEIDAMTAHQYLVEANVADQIAAFSVPAGCGRGEKQAWIELEWDRLERFEDIVLSFDGDKAGQDKVALEEIVHRLGVHRVRLMKLPHKDTNDCLVTHGMPAADYLDAFNKAKPMAPDELRNASEYVEGVLEKLYPENNEEPGVPMPWRRMSWIRIRRKEVSIWTGLNNHGKALDVDTPIPTIDGWKPMGDIIVGDTVFDDQGRPTQVIFTSHVMVDRPCYRLTFSDGSEIVADADHEWVTWTATARHSLRSAKANGRYTMRALKLRGNDQSHKRARPGKKTTAEIAATMVPPQKCWTHLANHSIEVAGAVERPFAVLPIDPYLLGLWLGDGHSWSAMYFTADDSLVQAFERGGFAVSKHKTKYNWGITGGFVALLRGANLIRNKHVPPEYLLASAGQRLALLQGLMDTDGHVTDYGRCEFTSTKPALAYAVLDIVQSLGHQAKILTERATLNGRDVGPKWRVTFTPEFEAFQLPRKADKLRRRRSERARHRFIVSCEPVESRPVRCIQVAAASHLFLAGWSYIPTHNTIGLNQLAMHMADRGEGVCIGSFEMPPHDLLERSARQLALTRRPSRDHVRRIHHWYDGRVWIIDRIGTMDRIRLIEVMRYARRRFGCTFFIIDSLMRCGIAEDDYQGQKNFVEDLTKFVDAEDCHVALVAHSRKLKDASQAPSRMDVAGAGGITNLVQCNFSMWRNEKKEMDLAALDEDQTISGSKREEKRADLVNKPDAYLAVDKQRFGTGQIGRIQLWFDRDSVSFKDKIAGDLPGFATVPRDDGMPL